MGLLTIQPQPTLLGMGCMSQINKTAILFQWCFVSERLQLTNAILLFVQFAVGLVEG